MDVRIQDLLLILLLSFMLALLLAGILIRRFKPFHLGERDRTRPDLNRMIGTGLIYIGSVLGGISLLLLVLSILEN